MTSTANSVGTEPQGGGVRQHGDLLERLEEGARDLHPFCLGEVDSPYIHGSLPAYLNEAAQVIRQQSEEIERLKRALEQFASVGRRIGECWDGAMVCADDSLTIDHFRRAAQAYDSLPPTEQTEKGALQTAPQSFVSSLPAEPPSDDLRGTE
jgi:hypothetical protein